MKFATSGDTRVVSRHEGVVTVGLKPFRYLGASMLLLGVALPKLPGHSFIRCPLLASTGIPCPFCGMTTSVEALLRGNLIGSLESNPFGILVVLVALTILLIPSLKTFVFSSRHAKFYIPLFLLASWIFQLFRFHIL